MKKRTFDRNNVYKNTEKLPAGGYVIKIMDAKEESFDWGDRLAIAFDIEEGEHKGFYDENFKSQQGEDKKWKGVFRLKIHKDDGSEKDAWTHAWFTKNIVAIEDSNPGFFFDWDESKLKGKVVGALFNNKEYSVNGRTGFYTACHSFVPAEKIRKGNFTIPKDTLLSNSTQNQKPATDNGFVSASSGEEEIPFL